MFSISFKKTNSVAERFCFFVFLRAYNYEQ